MIPAGPLRAPLDAQLERTQALIVLGEIARGAPVVAKAEAVRIPVFRGRLEPDPQALIALAGKEVLAFAGIADPQKFFATLAAAGIGPAAARAFPDHHVYSARNAARLLAEAETRGLDLVTTEKDVARMSGDPRLATLRARAKSLPVELMLDREAELRSLMLAAIRGR